MPKFIGVIYEPYHDSIPQDVVELEAKDEESARFELNSRYEFYEKKLYVELE